MAANIAMRTAPSSGSTTLVSLEQRDVVVDRVGDAVELLALGPLGGEDAREPVLARAQDVHAEASGVAHGPQGACAVVEAHEHEERVERERGDGVDGEPARAVV